ncbi:MULTISPECIES: rhodanese-like domain-containing protein [Bacillaceae]|jgi:rhodanese-related sulfurtransferase|uniref:Rhodanese domain protein n=2 Tax=Bacillaceae TaxID=186817 RepID=A0ABR5MGM0_9BACI|nr:MULTISPECIES: rhodanese-like domain-containing protein [Bacillales]KPH71470.1 rhodanese domain protein [Oceanobacillus caeni]MBU8791389.1 rhodanese-like domain-containing protein [Oceanobacillus caeni]MDA3129531.1 rhodanese-like domain-containing protein [Aliibacillus thermotolerans]MDF1511003.1 rhodanese-like domain-containing protein [Robertmurraya sp. DFI.2.37]GIO22288.1 rhodanese-like domain-containing protein [Oceanobacillus sp. J11TS1]
MKSISAVELHEKIKNGENVHIIDVREDVEVAEGKIPEAKHIPLGDIPNSLDKIDKNKHYYMVCRSGGRSSRACEFLINQGYNVTNMTGGMLAWVGEIE